jgi:hypothetical protein
MVTRHLQFDVAKPSAVDLSSEEVVRLGGDPSPSPSHPPRPTALGLCPAALSEVVGHVDKAHDVAHMLGDQLIVLIPWGSKLDVQISKQYGDMHLWAFNPCSLNVFQRSQIGWWDVTSHGVITLASQHHHKGDNIWSTHLPFLDLIEFVWFPKEGNPPLLDADHVGRKDIVTT